MAAEKHSPISSTTYVDGGTPIRYPQSSNPSVRVGKYLTVLRQSLIDEYGVFSAKIGPTASCIRLQLAGIDARLPLKARSFAEDKLPLQQKVWAKVISGPNAQGIYTCSFQHITHDGNAVALEELVREFWRDLRVKSLHSPSADVTTKGSCIMRAGKPAPIQEQSYSIVHRKRPAQSSDIPENDSASSCSPSKGKNHQWRGFRCPVAGCGKVKGYPKIHLSTHVPAFMTESSDDLTPATSRTRWVYLQELATIGPVSEGDLDQAVQRINDARYIEFGFVITPRLWELIAAMASVVGMPMPEEIQLIPICSPLALLHTRCLLFLAAEADPQKLAELNQWYTQTRHRAPTRACVEVLDSTSMKVAKGRGEALSSVLECHRRSKAMESKSKPTLQRIPNLRALHF
ncbi:uncharacterized protein LOC117114199 isoform X2 [Anneissia japonica]|uniref:uncharacterized protein LOC117114199 isoform X2 n=1 Tax=Anneissia japonica TaxID=1529436 RepID=UPI001425A7A2|nr:uncharacterized protein LOC117114199 isoform X2 [Anneissia japonica]